MTNPQIILQRLQKSLNILQERQATYGLNAPPDLIREIEDHQTAIELTRQLAAGRLAEADWRERLHPLRVNIEEHRAAGPASRLNVGGVSFDSISDSTITVGDIDAGVKAGGDVVGGDKVTQTAEGSHIAQASHGGHAEVHINSFDQRRQPVETQYNAGGDIHIYGQPAAAPSPRQRGVYVIAGAVLALAVNVAANLLSSGLEQQFFGGGFTVPSLWGLGLFALAGGLLGLWLSGPVTVPSPAAPPSQPAQPVTMTRLRALFSYTKLKGKGINLSDILLVGSRIDIDTRE